MPTSVIHDAPTRDDIDKAMHTLDMLIVALEDDAYPFSSAMCLTGGDEERMALTYEVMQRARDQLDRIAATATHVVTVRDFTPGTGPSIMVHRRGCRCQSVDKADERHPSPGTMENACNIAANVARRWGLEADDYGVMDCALGI